jgi:hypothetical protein
MLQGHSAQNGMQSRKINELRGALLGITKAVFHFQ